MKWLVIGIGDITRRRVIPGILSEPRSELAAIVTRAAAKAEPYGVPAYEDLARALDRTAVDAVYVATPVFLHHPQTVLSLRAGKHVLCEKPMGMSYPEAVDMQREAERADRMLGIAYYSRMYPKIHRARQLLEQGVIGKPVLAEATSHSWFVQGDGEWRADPVRAGGGPLYDIASHRIDLMNYLFGTPARATGYLSNIVHDLPVEDNATVLIGYESGFRAIVDVRWHSRVERDEFRIRGTDGEMDLTPLNGPALVYPGGSENVPRHENLHFPCIENFVDAVLGLEPLRASGASSLWTDWVTEKVLQAPAAVNPA
jgi:predicted dehydrogenase